MQQYGKMTAEGFAMGMETNKGQFDVTHALQLPGAGIGPVPDRLQTPEASTTPSGGITINIENPKKETAEESIRKTLKSLSYTGAIPA